MRKQHTDFHLPHSMVISSPAGILLLASLSILTASLLRAYPMLAIARTLSPDGFLTTGFRAELQLSQWCLGFSLAAGSLVAFLAMRICTTARFTVVVSLSAAGAAIVTFALQFLWFENIPHVTDAISQWFQSRILAAGRPFARLPPCWRWFAHDNLIMSPAGMWHTKYFPSHSLWLASFQMIHVPWACADPSRESEELAAYYGQ